VGEESGRGGPRRERSERRHVGLDEPAEVPPEISGGFDASRA